VLREVAPTNMPTPRTKKQSADIQRLDYHAPESYRLDLEIFPVTDLVRRGSKEQVRATHRYAFHMLVCVTHGACMQLVDFEPMACEPGSMLVLRPGQAHSFGHDEDWDGWVILFRSEFLLTASAPARELKLAVDLEGFPEHVRLDGQQLRTVMDAIAQMRKDTMIDAPAPEMHALLRYQLYALLSRLSILHGRQSGQGVLNSRALQRFKRFRQLVEECFSKWHQVAEYAERLGCTEKSLMRAATVAAGMSAKAFVTSRINLEAKRLLVHTDASVAMVAEKLGFQEATNFSKFFKRETGCTPAEFRRRHAVENSRS
jgi:AraC-like DNA-binding protein